MTEQDRPQPPQSRDIDSLQPEEYQRYYQVPGWRIWERNISDALSERSEERKTALETIEANPLALAVRTDGKGYYYVDNKMDEITGRHISILFNGPGTFDRSWYMLEPLTAEQVSKIDEEGEASGPLGSTDKPHEILRPEDLKNILELNLD